MSRRRRLALVVLASTLIATLGHGALEPPQREAFSIVSGNTAFGFDLYARLRAQEGNLFLSPYSISTALAMTYGGARGGTAAKMAKVLHFDLPQEQLHLAFAAAQAWLNTVQAKGKVQFAVANSLWPQQGYRLLPEYLDLCKKQYGVTITPVDFAGATEKARATINGWVEDRTNKKIQELFQRGVLDATARLVLVNAIYFKGDWLTPFDKTVTRPEPFHVSTAKTVNAPLMHTKQTFRYAESPELQTLELPYAGNDLSMVVLLPRKVDALPALEESLTARTFAVWTKGLRARKVELWLPKFKAVAQFSLEQTLAALGMTDAFDSLRADFSGMSGEKSLFISAVVHKAFVDVNEEGTEAAAATGVAIALRSAPPREEMPVVFRADHPFLFVIRDNRTGSILFLGRIVDPTR